jgi:hypothetical protein
MATKSITRNLWKQAEKPRFTTWYEPLDEQPTIDAAVEFALRRPEISGLCTAGEMRLLPMMVEAEQRRGTLVADKPRLDSRRCLTSDRRSCAPRVE